MGDVTSGGVQDDAAANADIGGGGRDTSPSYSDLGQSPGAMGGRVPDVQPSVYGGSFDPGVYSEPLSSNVMGGNPAIPSLATNDAYQANLDFLSGIQTLTGGGMSPGAMGGRISDDSPTFSSRPDPSTAMPLSVMTRPTGSVFREDNDPLGDALRDQSGRLAVTFGPAGLYSPSDASGNLAEGPAFAALEKGSERNEFRMRPINEPMGGGRILPELEADPFAPLGGTGVSPETVRSRRFDDTGGIDARQRPDPNEINMFSSTATQDFPPPGPGLGLIDSPALARAIANQKGTLPSQIGDNLDAKKVFSLGKGTIKPKTQEELNILQRLGRFLKGVGKSISNFEMNDIFEFLRGDPNFKGPSAAQQDLFGVPGPGPFVGGGAPSPSGGGGGGGMPAKDPCPPGFRFDPTLQQCVPLIAPNTPIDTTTTPTTTTTPATGTSPPVAGGIADAYPFVLTPTIGKPIGTLPPIQFAPN